VPSLDGDIKDFGKGNHHNEEWECHDAGQFKEKPKKNQTRKKGRGEKQHRKLLTM
jgi:hypothetical protein